MSRQAEQSTFDFDRGLEPVYNGSIGEYGAALPFVCWDYAPNWFDHVGDIPPEPNSKMHILGDEVDGYGERMTICFTPARASAVLGIERVYHDNEADRHARERGIHMCEFCFGYMGKAFVMSFRHNREVRKVEVPKWTKLERADNFGIKAGRPFKVVGGHHE